jgi:hypothetical protein
MVDRKWGAKTKAKGDERAALPTKDFGLPGRAKTAEGKAKPGSFTLNTTKRAKAAIGLSKLSEKRGNITPAQRAEIVRKADAKLGQSKGTPKKK